MVIIKKSYGAIFVRLELRHLVALIPQKYEFGLKQFVPTITENIISTAGGCLLFFLPSSDFLFFQ